MTLHVKDAGTWKTVNNVYVKDSGTWKEATYAYVKDAGTWKAFHEPSGSSYYYTLDGSGASGSGTFVGGGSVSADPASGANPFFNMSYYSSSPPGFWQGNSMATPGAFSSTCSSTSKTASPGTTVYLTYKIDFESDVGTAEPIYITFTHNF